MISKKQIAVELDGLMSLRGLVEVYEEIAASRMQKVRGAVLQSRQFLEGLLAVFAKVKAAYSASESTIVRNGKSVAVFVSANSGLYGDIVDRTFEMFTDYVLKEKPNVVVLGKLGVKMMADRMPSVLYNFYDFSDDGVDMESFDLIMRYLIQFEKIFVFYGQFKTILSQDPAITSVSGDTIEIERIEKQERAMGSHYLFEPSPQDIARVFEGEILASIFEQTLHESQLAKFASRMLALDRSVENIEGRLGIVRREGVKVRHKLVNKKQLSTIAGIALWSRNV